MSLATDFRDKVEKAFQPNGRGIVGVVDDLIDLSQEHGLHLEWHEQRCAIRALDGGSPAIELPMQKSVFRAVLARVAALCNEREPGSASPYGGEGELASATNSTRLIQVRFANRPNEQCLELLPRS